MLILQVLISILTGIMSPLVWSMYADVSDYSELRTGSASTGLIFSSASMAQKFGGAFGGAAVMWILEGAGYIARADGMEGVAIAQPESALHCLWYMMTFIPAGVALLSTIIVWFYPLDSAETGRIVRELARRRPVTTTEAADAGFESQTM